MAFNMTAFEANKASLFKDTATLPSLACRRRCVSSAFSREGCPVRSLADARRARSPRRFIDAMLVQREIKAGASDFAQRIATEDKGRLVRDRLYLLKQCVIAGKDADSTKEPYLFNLH
jgi:hypothetical protein